MKYRKMLFGFLVLSSAVCFLASVSFSATTVCQWKDNKTAAFSMSFDDALVTHSLYGIPNMVSRGLTGTFFAPIGNTYGGGIMIWESLCNRAGIELGNHTLYHGGAATQEIFTWELGQPSENIWKMNPPGTSKLNLFVQPGSGSWPTASEMNTVAAIYSASWSRGVGITTLEGSGGLVKAKQTITTSISGGTWGHYYWHGLGPGAEWLWTDRGWNGEDFLTFLDYLLTVKNQLWIGTSVDITKYVAEKAAASVSVLEETSSLVRINLTSTANAALYNYPLTLVTDVQWTGYAKVSQNGNIIAIKPVSSGKVMYDAVPNAGEIRLESSADDATPPGTPVVRDGTGADIDTTSDLESISANWDACTDLESGVVKYWYKVGTSPGSSELLDWINNGTFTYVTTGRTNMQLYAGATYYVTVKAVNGAGLESAEGISNGVYVPATSGFIKFADNFESGDFSRWDWHTQAGANTIEVTGEAAYKGSYGLKLHVEDTNGAYVEKMGISTVISNFVKVYFKFNNLTLPAVTASDPTLFSIVNIGDVGDGLVAQLGIGNVTDATTKEQKYCMFLYYTDNNGWQCMPSWADQYNAYYPVTADAWHSIDIHTIAKACPVGSVGPHNGGVELWLDGVKLGSLRWRDTAGKDARNLSIGAIGIGTGVTGDVYFDNITWSDSLVAPAAEAYPPSGTDTVPPSAPAAVRDGTTTDSETTSTGNQLSANWEAVSGAAKYWYAIGTTSGGTELVDWTDNGNVTSVTKTGLTLVSGTKYYFSVKAENGAGVKGTAANSNGITYTSDGGGGGGGGGDTTPAVNPKPFSRSNDAQVKFLVSSGASGGTLKVFTLNGKLVKSLTVDSGANISWDGTNDDGQKVARGIYIYKITDSVGNRTGKIAVVK